MVGEWGGAGEHDADAVKADAGLDLVEDERVPEGVLVVAAMQPVGLGVHGLLEEAGLDPAARSGALRDLVIDLVVEAGHAGEQGGPQHLEVLQDLARVALEVADGGAGVPHGRLHDALKGVREGQVADVQVLGGEVQPVNSGAGHVGDPVAVRDHGALRAGAGAGAGDGAPEGCVGHGCGARVPWGPP